VVPVSLINGPYLENISFKELPYFPDYKYYPFTIVHLENFKEMERRYFPDEEITLAASNAVCSLTRWSMSLFPKNLNYSRRDRK
jgi:hypothetical protein